ncbi:MAG: hypothetical protein K2N63_17480 [Lachnospiraceae bacterium]|nr:hypothetical protein [Lachnospiraceae bacterium]
MAGKRNPYHYDPDYYVHGSAVRKLNTSQAQKAGGAKKKNIYETGAQPARKERETIKPVRKQEAPKPVRKKVPQREPDRYERLRKQQEQRDEKKLFSISRSIGFFGILTLCGAMFLVGLLCVRYLDLKAESTRLDKTVASLKDELSVLVDTNAGKEQALVENIDLDAIYQTAVGEYGMVFPNKNTVIYYDPADLSYVRQYADIPEAAASILDKLVP